MVVAEVPTDAMSDGPFFFDAIVETPSDVVRRRPRSTFDIPSDNEPAGDGTEDLIELARFV